MMAEYWNMSSARNGRTIRRKEKTQTTAATTSPATPDYITGIGTKSCFTFRPPRTIITAEVSDDEELSHPSDEQRLGLLSAVRLTGTSRSWISPSLEPSELESMTPTRPTPKSNGIHNQEGGILAMPTPTDRSQRKRLQMERGGKAMTYDDEQEPVGYRGQEAISTRGSTSAATFGRNRSSHQRRVQGDRQGKGEYSDGEQESQSIQRQGANFPHRQGALLREPQGRLPIPTTLRRSQGKSEQIEGKSRGMSNDEDDSPVRQRQQLEPSLAQSLSNSRVKANFVVNPTARDRSHRGRMKIDGRESRGNKFSAEQETQDLGEQESASQLHSSSLLAMPMPTDRSHRRRLQMEREGQIYTYDGEQEPMGFRGQSASAAPIPSVPSKNDREVRFLELPPVKDRSRQPRRSIVMDDREDHSPIVPPSQTRASGPTKAANKIPATNYLPRREQKGSSESVSVKQMPVRVRGPVAGMQESPANGTPYLQFSPEGPSMRVFEGSPKHDDTRQVVLVSASSSLLVTDPRVMTDDDFQFTTTERPLRKPGPANFQNQYSSENDKKHSQRSHQKPRNDWKPSFQKSRTTGYETATTEESSTPERAALAIVRSNYAGEEISIGTDSTRSSEILDDMRTDFFRDEEEINCGGSVATVNSLTDTKDMAAAAQEHVSRGEYDLALVLFGQVLALYRKKYGDVHPLVASAYHNLGMVHSQRASLLLEGTLQQSYVRQQSLECFQASARSARDALGKNHPNVAVTLVKIGFLLLHARRYEPAQITFEEALRIRLHHYGHEPHTLVSNLYSNLGVVKMHLLKFSEAKEDLNNALEIQRHLLRIERMKCSRDELRLRLLEVGDTLANLGGLGLEWLRHDGLHDDVMLEAENQLAEALEIRSTVLGPDHPLTMQVKSLHDMVRSTPSSYSLALLSPENRNDKKSLGSLEEKLPISPISPAKSTSTSSIDAPAQKAHLHFPGIPLEEQKGAPRGINPPEVLSRESIGLKPKSRLSNHERASMNFPPVPDVVVDDDENLYSVDLLNRSSSSRGRTRIYVAPHDIPSRSPTPNARGETKSSHFDLKTELESTDELYSRSHAYDSEESCLLNESGDRADLLSRFLVDESELDDESDEVNVSLHEIMVVRPIARASNMSPPTTPERASEGKIEGLWQGDVKRNIIAEESGDGIAPLRRLESNTIDQKVHLSESMLEEPLHNLADIYSAACRYLKKNRMLEAKHLFTAVLDCQREIHGELHEDVGSALHNIGLVHLRSNDYEQAADFFERAVRVRKGSLGRQHPEVATSQVKVGISLLLLQQFDTALQAFLDALSIRKHALGELHPSVANIYVNIGCLHVELNELRDARRAFEGALDIQRNCLCNEPDSGPLKFGVATTLCNLGYLYRYREMHQKAALVLNEGLNLQESVLGHSHPTVLATMDSLADALLLSGDSSRALQYFREILDRFQHMEVMSKRFQAEALILYKMSRAHRKQNDVEAEAETLQQALRILRTTGIKTSSDKKRKVQLEERILGDMQRSRDQLCGKLS